jgi:hypothetical protein
MRTEWAQEIIELGRELEPFIDGSSLFYQPTLEAIEMAVVREASAGRRA